MALIVKEVMNPEVFSLSPRETAQHVRQHLLTLGISAAPVVDEEHRPMGMLTLQDLFGVPGETPVLQRMNRPPLSVQDDVSIEEAGRLLAETGYHHLAVVDKSARLVGMLSSLDVVRGLLGLPAVHPASFPHYDARTGLVWSDDTLLTWDHIEAAPDGPGIFVLIDGGKDVRERIVWAEAAESVRKRLIEVLSGRQERALQFWLELDDLRFRAAEVPDASERQTALRAVVATMSSLTPERSFAREAS